MDNELLERLAREFGINKINEIIADVERDKLAAAVKQQEEIIEGLKQRVINNENVIAQQREQLTNGTNAAKKPSVRRRGS